MLRVVAVAAVAILAAGCLDAVGAERGPSLPQALLWRSLSRSILVEVDAVPGHGPDPGTLDLVRDTLATVTGKPVTMTAPSPMAPQGGNYREGDLLRIHRREAFFGEEAGALVGDRAVLHVLYLDGRMAGDDATHRTLGRTLMDAGLVAVFHDTYAGSHRVANDTASPAAAEMDRHVLLHEVGHALGLVNNGVPQLRDHMDPDFPGHSRYPESVMYDHPPMTPAGLVTGDVSTSFDVDDLADLAAFRANDPHAALPAPPAAPVPA